MGPSAFGLHQLQEPPHLCRTLRQVAQRHEPVLVVLNCLDPLLGGHGERAPRLLSHSPSIEWNSLSFWPQQDAVRALHWPT
eukprot:318477-Pelagomonas_calceolata.AAC.3